MNSRKLHFAVTAVLIALIALSAGAISAPAPIAAAQAAAATQVPTSAPAKATVAPGLPPAKIANDEGGPAIVSGEWDYKGATVGQHYKEPVAALLNLSRQIQGDFTQRVPLEGQILGTLTRPFSPAPTAYQVRVQVEPGGPSADLDNDGVMDAGVKVFAAVLGANIVGDSYLEQLEYESSYLADPQTGAIRRGALLVYAPDDSQGFPSGAGADGIFFTVDDPAVALPAGYTLATLTEDGRVSFDRSRKVTMDILVPVAAASPDFSKQGILESYNSLIDMLKERYSYTALRKLDWEKIRKEYLPRVQAADKAGDFSAYYLAMNDLALSIRDAHVYTLASNPEIKNAPLAAHEAAFGGGLGVQVVEMSDGRFVVIYLDPHGPGADAGWTFGTEIVSVDGAPIGKRVATLPLKDSAGNPESIRVAQTKTALNFPVGTKTTIEYRQPGESELRLVTLTAVEGASVDAPGPQLDDSTMNFKQLDNGVFYIQWKMFDDPLYKIAMWEKFLERAQGAPGIIIDLRGNGGGSVGLLYSIASYLFPAGKPALLHWMDSYTYDDKAGDLVKEFAANYALSSPKPELTFRGAVVVLVDQNSASAAEYFPQFLQRQGRAVVVGEHGTEGAGGYLEFAAMPGGFSFLFTKGRTTFAGTDELNLEAKGVTLDVRVPITEENEQAKQEGRDVVLEAGVAAVGEEVARLAAERLPNTTWQLTLLQEIAGDKTAKLTIENPEAYTVTFGEDGALTVQAACNQVMAEYTMGSAGAITIKPGAATLAACPGDSLGERFVQALSIVATLQTDGKILVLDGSKEEKIVFLQFQIAR